MPDGKREQDLAGIYIHIPFCKQACYYCDFHFSTSLKQKEALVSAIITEIALQKNYLNGESIKTIYFGGGTPSLLSEVELEAILNQLGKVFHLEKDLEITLEANPDDLNLPKLQSLKALGVNRLSIGIQSFQDSFLTYLHRAHDSKQAIQVMKNARKAGFSNISLDLIYAIPAQDHTLWQADLHQILELKPEHISSYCLTIEKDTVFGRWYDKGKLKVADDEFAAEQFEILLSSLNLAGYEQYEVSNFCLPDYYSRHNSSYWKQEKYLGVGPSAHSYNGSSRQFNVANNTKYIKALEAREIPFEREELDKNTIINEHIMIGLRTKWGCNVSWLKSNYNFDLFLEKNEYISLLLNQGLAFVEDDRLILTAKGRLLADEIAAEFFLV